MSDLPVIPTPLRQRIREWRVRFLPALVFMSTLGAILVLWRGYVVSPPEFTGQAESVVAVPTSGTLTNLHGVTVDASPGPILGQIRH